MFCRQGPTLFVGVSFSVQICPWLRITPWLCKVHVFLLVGFLCIGIQLCWPHTCVFARRELIACLGTRIRISALLPKLIGPFRLLSQILLYPPCELGVASVPLDSCVCDTSIKCIRDPRVPLCILGALLLLSCEIGLRKTVGAESPPVLTLPSPEHLDPKGPREPQKDDAISYHFLIQN